MREYGGFTSATASATKVAAIRAGSPPAWALVTGRIATVISAHCRSAVVLTALALLGWSAAIPAHAQDAAKSHWQFLRKTGQEFRYRIVQTITGELPDGKEFRYNTTQTVRRVVKAVDHDGVAKFEETTESRKREVMGHVMPEEPKRYSVIEQEVAPNGLVVFHKEAEDVSPEGLSALAVMLNQFPVPKTGVALQEKWHTPIANLMVKGKTVDLTSQLVAREKIGTTDTLRVAFDMEIPPRADADEIATILVKGSYNIDPKAGVVLRADYTVENFELPMAQGSIKATSRAEITLVSVAEAAAPHGH
jgi:hypothetical protein